MKNEFVMFLNAIMEANPEVTKKLMTPNIEAYIEALTSGTKDKPILTDNGKIVLKYLQDTNAKVYKSRDIADALYISSRAVSGALRKLVSDGFCEKVGQDPVIYTLTEKGKNFKI